MRDLIVCTSFADTILHIFIACTTVFGGLNAGNVIMENTRCGGGDGEATGPASRTLITLTTGSAWIIRTVDLNLTIGGTKGSTTGIGAGQGSTSEAIGPGW